MTKRTSRGRGASPVRRAVAVAALALLAAACDTEGLLEVEDPDVTLPEDLFDPANLPSLRATVIGDFGVAFGGAGQTNGLVMNVGLVTDEFNHSGTFGQNRELDKRGVAITNSSVATVARALYKARRSAQLGIRAYEELQPNTAQHAEMHSLLGYVHVFFAENWCSGVPFSEDNDGVFEFGAGDTRDQMYARATADFDRAIQIATAANSSTQLALARMGKARVLLGQNNYAAAAALAAQVPSSFVYAIEYSDNSTRQNNGVWGLNHSRREIGASSSEGGEGVAFLAGNTTTENQQVSVDPRIVWSWRNGAADTRSVHFFQHKFDEQSTPIPLASGTEARLIEAEAALNRGASDAYLPILNSLRGNVGLAALADPGTAAGRVNQFFAERAIWLFATGHRLSDLRRLVRQYGRPATSVFPSGEYTRPGTTGPRSDGEYGTDVNFPVVIDEQNNPNFQQCTDRAA